MSENTKYVPDNLIENNMNNFNKYANELSENIRESLFGDFTAIVDNKTEMIDFSKLTPESVRMFNNLSVVYMSTFMSLMTEESDQLLEEIINRASMDARIYKNNLNNIRKH